jgi:hypothetical protein
MASERIRHAQTPDGDWVYLPSPTGDHLTARAEKAEADNTFARAEWAHWEAEACRIEKERKALEARLAEVERERDEARVERDFLVDEYERALRIEPRGWAHAAGHLYNAIVNAKFEANWKYSEKLRADRDALAGIVERVRGIEPVSPGSSFVYHDDILTALTPTREVA